MPVFLHLSRLTANQFWQKHIPFRISEIFFFSLGSAAQVPCVLSGHHISWLLFQGKETSIPVLLSRSFDPIEHLQRRAVTSSKGDRALSTVEKALSSQHMGHPMYPNLCEVWKRKEHNHGHWAAWSPRGSAGPTALPQAVVGAQLGLIRMLYFRKTIIYVIISFCLPHQHILKQYIWWNRTYQRTGCI